MTERIGVSEFDIPLGTYVPIEEYNKIKQQQDKLRELLIDAWNVLDDCEPNHPITSRILAVLADTETDGDNS